ncbi:nucleoside-diphosphate-sugar epimerase [Flavobacteriaceae bacterium MAR_2009_75]|nr:nucleoside-diphosphate-sugar epimerase [Flavobacteriaceae bacterium MAR_2009_75]
MNKTIAVLGCGWLGLPLAQSFLKNGYQVKGSTTTKDKLKELEQLGITPFQIGLKEDRIEGDIDSFLKNIEVLIINVPPKLRSGNGENYVMKMKLLYSAIQESSIKKVIFVSSTSVYGDIEGNVSEETNPQPSTESGKQLLVSENIFRNDNNIQSTIIRFGGLIGPERHPVTMLSGRTNLKNGHHPINLIHLNDCIKLISEIIAKNWYNETFNGVYPFHPKKEDYYISEAIKRNIQPPDYKIITIEKGKTVQSYNLTNVKGFMFTTTL